MTDLERLIEELQTEFEDREGDSEMLDDLVIDVACSMGSAVNNGGVASQIAFLIEQGCTAKDIKGAFGG